MESKNLGCLFHLSIGKNDKGCLETSQSLHKIPVTPSSACKILTNTRKSVKYSIHQMVTKRLSRITSVQLLIYEADRFPGNKRHFSSFHARRAAAGIAAVTFYRLRHGQPLGTRLRDKYA